MIKLSLSLFLFWTCDDARSLCQNRESQVSWDAEGNPLAKWTLQCSGFWVCGQADFYLAVSGMFTDWVRTGLQMSEMPKTNYWQGIVVCLQSYLEDVHVALMKIKWWYWKLDKILSVVYALLQTCALTEAVCLVHADCYSCSCRGAATS